MAQNGQPLKKPPGYKDPNVRGQNQTAQPNPVRKPALPPSFYQTQNRPKRRSCCRTCCCTLCILLVVLLLVVAVVVGLFFLWFQPKLPVFRFRSIELTRFNVTAWNDGSTFLDSQTVFKVEARNPNSKLVILYGGATVGLMADDGETWLGTAYVPAFSQGANNVTILKFTAEVNNQEIDDTVAARLKAKVKSQQMAVEATVKTKIGMEVGGLKVGMLRVRVTCGGATMKELSNDGANPKCSIHTLKWINIH